MRRLLKILIIVALLAGIYLLSPYFFGIAAQKYSFRFLANENDTLGKVLGIHMDFAQYNRGWFTSKALLQVERKTADGNFEIIQKVPLTIVHGPSYRVNNHFWTGVALVRVADFPIDQSAYEVSFHDNIGFSGERGAFLFVANKNKQSSSNNVHFDSVVLHVKSNVDANFLAFGLDGKKVSYVDPNHSVQVQLQDLQSTLTARYVSHRHWKLQFGFGLGTNHVSVILPGNTAPALVADASRVDLQGLHFDTQQIGEWLADVVKLKQATDAQQPVKPAEWMGLIQQFLTQIIENDTWFNVKNLVVHSPMGDITAHYTASFPTLKSQHDYFDIATSNVGTLMVSVPKWTYSNAENNMQLSLSDLNYNDYNNTVFSRHSQLKVGALTFLNTKMQPTTTGFSLNGLQYQSELNGNILNLSQNMQLQIDKLCNTNDCLHQITSDLQFLHMNYNAFRGIAAATQKIVQFDPTSTEYMQARWVDLGNAYANLVEPNTKVLLNYAMQTAQGGVQMKGQLSWFALQPTQKTTLSDLMRDSTYRLRVQFPAVYVTTFFDQQRSLSAQPVVNSPEAKAEPSFEKQVADFLHYAVREGYLKKTGDAYLADLTGTGEKVSINGVPWKMPVTVNQQ